MADAIHFSALQGVQAVIQGLDLTGLPEASPLPDERVYLRKLPAEWRGLILPCVVVSLVPLPELNPGTLTQSEDYGYPCLVTVIVPNNQDLTLVEAELKWRERVKQAFQRKRPAALVTELGTAFLFTTWEPSPVLDLDLFKQANLFVSAAVVRVNTREVRT